MYTYYIVKAGETAPEERIVRAIKNYNYENEDVVCIAVAGYTSELETVRTLRVELNDFESDIDELAQKYIEKKKSETINK